MSVRLEWTTAEYVQPALYREGDELEDGNVVDNAHLYGPLALAIGTTVVQGTRGQLLTMVGAAQALLEEASASPIPEGYPFHQ